MDDPQDQGDEIHDEAVKDGDKSHLDTTGNDVGRDVICNSLKETCRLMEAEDGPEDAHDQAGDADFLHPGGGFPGSEEEADEQKGNDNHSDGTAGDEERE